MGSSAHYNADVTLIRDDSDKQKILLRVSSDIYYEDYDDEEEEGEEEGGINETESTFIITQEFIDSLKPGDMLILSGDGSCY